jgi:hypothetical protein
MSHEQSQAFSFLQGFGDNILLLGIIPVVIVLFLVYKKFGTDSRGYGSEGFLKKFEHKFVKIAVTLGVAALVIGGAHVMGFL